MSRFRRRLMGLAALRQAAADDYVRVEYLENISNAYIDTLIKPIANRRYVLDCAFTTLDSWGQNGCMQDLGNGTFNRCHFGIRSNLTDFQGCLQRSIYNWQPVDTDRHIWEIGYRNVKFDDTTKGTTTNDNYLPNVTFCLFARKTNDSVADFCLQKVYSFKIYNGDLLVRDFIPMYQKSKDLYGLWDRVKEEFYVSPNGVKFIGGARVVADANDNLYYLKDYIKCNGTTNTFINLSKFTNLDNVEFEVYSNTAHDNFIGSRSGTPTRNHFQIAKWTNTRIDISFGQQNPASITSKNTDNKKFKIKLWERIIYLDNKKFYTCPNNTFTTNTVVSLGAVKGLSQPTSARFYWFKWWNKDKDLIYDMIPVQRISDGVWGMFCKVHLGFYPSNGSAQFTGG